MKELPEWAVARTDRPVIGAMMPTRDGRKIGNAWIIAHWPESDAWEVLTESGNQLAFTSRELNEFFHPPEFVGDVDDIQNKWGLE